MVAREVTLLPRHWDWLAGQPGGASAVRALYAGDAERLAAHMAGWPADVRAYALRLAGAADLPA
ncbi:Uncharacterized protein conserved in bacteria [Bordetella pertussis]|nr:Uncharacterized protein conserved in bacteria [Bordetella pertussis]